MRSLSFHRNEAGWQSFHMGWLLFVILSIAGCTQAVAAPPSGYSLVWSDEFNQGVGNPPSSANWTYDYGAGGWGNGELQTYTNDLTHSHIVSDPNATDGQALQIQVTDDNGGVGTAGQYTSARLKSLGLVQPQYGFIEARIKIPYGDGIWPAFWMLGANINTVGWPACGESDIMENPGMQSWWGKVQCTAHGATTSGSMWQVPHWYDLPAGQYFYTGYHLFQELWQPNSITYYVDGNFVGTASTSNNGGNPWQLNQPMFFLLNIAVGGPNTGWPGPPDASTVFPQTMLVDYVRLYQSTSGTASFTDTATASPTSVTANSPVTITENVKDTGAATSGVIVDCEVYDSTGTRVFQQYTSNQSFNAGQSQQYTYTWTPSTAGTYTVEVGVFSANWASSYVFNNNVATVTVTGGSTPPSFTATATASPSSVTVNSPVTITATANNTGAATSGAIVDCEVYNSTGTQVFQQYTSNQNFSAGQSQQYTYTWTPSTAGTYTVEVGVFNANWSTNYVFNKNAATVTVTAAPPPSFTATATASPTSVAANSPVTITATANDTGGATSGAIVDCEVYNSTGTRVFQQYTSNQSFSAGQSQQYTYTWTPSAAGTYTVEVGVFSANWATNYVFNNNAASVTVTSTSSLTPVVQIDCGSPSAVNPFVADQYFDTGNQYSSSATINTSGASNPAPAAVYQTVRWNSSFNYTIPNLTAGASYTVRLHFCELTWTAAGQRVFNVAINGASALSNFDVFAAAGGQNKAVTEQFTTTANSSGQIVISFTRGSADNPEIAGIEVLH